MIKGPASPRTTRRNRQAPSRQNSNGGGSAEPADLLLGHDALDVLGLALDAVARATVRLDRQTGDNGVDASLLDRRAALRPLQLVMNVVIDREIVGHRLSSG